MDNTGREYRYQWDWNVPGGMAHVRCDNWDEFKVSKENMETLITPSEAYPNDVGRKMATTPEQAQAVTNAPSWCKIHKETMKQFTKNGQSWYSHKVGETWCNGK